jgi:hypothetical protein
VVATSASSRRRGGSVALSLMFTEIRRDKNNPLDHFCGRNTSTTKLREEFARVENSSKSRTSV